MPVPLDRLSVELRVEPPTGEAAERQLQAALDVARAAGIDVHADGACARLGGQRATLLDSLPQVTAAAVAAGALRVSVLLAADHPPIGG